MATGWTLQLAESVFNRWHYGHGLGAGVCQGFPVFGWVGGVSPLCSCFRLPPCN